MLLRLAKLLAQATHTDAQSAPLDPSFPCLPWKREGIVPQLEQRLAGQGVPDHRYHTARLLLGEVGPPL